LAALKIWIILDQHGMEYAPLPPGLGRHARSRAELIIDQEDFNRALIAVKLEFLAT
jgi:hypothetical protein